MAALAFEHLLIEFSRTNAKKDVEQQKIRLMNEVIKIELTLV